MKPPRHEFVWLASQSPRRARLLDQLGVCHQLLLADADEDAEALEHERPGEGPEAYVRRVTRAKLDAARRRLAARQGEAAPILVADTTVALGRRILGKPADAGDARRILRQLSGRTHRVLTAVEVHDGRRRHEAISVSHVRFSRLDDATIERYIASGEPFGKAGAYAVQGPIAAWIERLAGSPSGVMGLPLYDTRMLLERAGVRCGLAPAQ